MKIKKIIIGVAILIVLYVIGTQVLGLLIEKGITNSKSDESMIKATEIYLLPKDVLENKGVQFTLSGIHTRKVFVDSVSKYSELLGVDEDLVMACVLAEQIRISTKGVRGNLKWLILNSTPNLLRSYNVSLGIGGIKLDTAYKIRRDACEYRELDDSNARDICKDTISEEKLSDNDEFNAKYATYLVSNIVMRWRRAGFEIKDKPGIVCTLYNMGNNEDKIPNGNPKVGGAIIPINGKNYTYGAIGMGVYYHLKLNQ